MKKELATSRNIKDRCNRQNVTTTLNRIGEFVKTLTIDENGLFLFFGFDQFGDFVTESVIPIMKFSTFYYSCSSKFETDRVIEYMDEKTGSITFISGEECFIYELRSGSFVRIHNMSGNLQKRQKKGGQSAQRIERNAELSRTAYITRVVDNLNLLETDNNWIFGADEMRDMTLKSSKLLLKISDGGFLVFNNSTIKDRKYVDCLNIRASFEDKYKQVILYLSTNVDMFDFDIEQRNSDHIDYYLGLDGIPLSSELSHFQYIGVRYFPSFYEE